MKEPFRQHPAFRLLSLRCENLSLKVSSGKWLGWRAFYPIKDGRCTIYYACTRVESTNSRGFARECHSSSPRLQSVSDFQLRTVLSNYATATALGLGVNIRYNKGSSLPPSPTR